MNMSNIFTDGSTSYGDTIPLSSWAVSLAVDREMNVVIVQDTKAITGQNFTRFWLPYRVAVLLLCTSTMRQS